MRKVIYGICAVAFIALIAVNVSIAVNGEKKAKLTLASLVSLANNESPGNGESPATDANNSSGLLWKEYFYDCSVTKYVVITGCGSFNYGSVIGAGAIASLEACGGTYSTSIEAGIKSYCFDGPRLCWSNSNCH